MYRGWLITAILVAACRGEAPPASERGAGAAESAASADGAAAASEIAAALAQQPRVLARVVALRQLDARRSVVSSQQSVADYRRYLARELARDFPPGELEDLAAMSAHFGFTRERIDLARAFEDYDAAGTTAYYDTVERAFYIIDPEDVELTMAHELAHALQDQHFDLAQYMRLDQPDALTTDAATARLLVAEGDASFVEDAYDAAAEGVDLLGSEDQLELYTRASDANTRAEWWTLKRYLGDAREVEFFAYPVAMAYVRGPQLIATVYRHGGWPAVNGLLVYPPDSTEQILHPEDKLLSERDHPTPIRLPDNVPGADEWTSLDTDVLGELAWRSYFEMWDTPRPSAAATGWDGDRITFYRSGTGLVAVAVTTWDSEEDADEFARAYRSAVENRFPWTAVGPTGLERPDGTRLWFERIGRDVVIVDGAPDHELARFQFVARNARP